MKKTGIITLAIIFLIQAVYAQGNISVELYRPTCGVATLLRTVKTNSTGYYAFGNLNGAYLIVPHHFSYTFAPESDVALIPQGEIQSYDFSATAD